jgi:hypothetical protein
MKDDRLKRLADLAGLIRDAKLAELSQHVQVCAQIRDRIAGLDAPVPTGSDLPVSALQAAALRHDRWAAPRRMALNERLALVMAQRMTIEAQARIAFGRAQILEQLQTRQPRP